MGHWDSRGIFYHTEIYWKLLTSEGISTLYINNSDGDNYREWLQSYIQAESNHKITQEFDSEGEMTSHSNDTIDYVYVENTIQLPEASGGLFNMCSKLKQIFSISSLDISNCKYLPRFFGNCSTIETLDLRGFNFSNCENLSNMFSSCTNLKEIVCDDLVRSYKIYTNVTDLTGTFSDCAALKMSGNLSATEFLSMFEFSKLISISYLFKGCCKTSYWFIDLSDVFPSAIESGGNLWDYSFAFYDCTYLQGIKLWEFIPDHDANINKLFSNCDNLQYIYSKYNWNPDSTPYVFKDSPKLPGYESKGVSSEYCKSVEKGGYFILYDDYDKWVYFNDHKVLNNYTVYKNSTKWSSIIFKDEEWILEE